MRRSAASSLASVTAAAVSAARPAGSPARFVAARCLCLKGQLFRLSLTLELSLGQFHPRRAGPLTLALDLPRLALQLRGPLGRGGLRLVALGGEHQNLPSELVPLRCLQDFAQSSQFCRLGLSLNQLRLDLGPRFTGGPFDLAVDLLQDADRQFRGAYDRLRPRADRHAVRCRCTVFGLPVPSASRTALIVGPLPCPFDGISPPFYPSGRPLGDQIRDARGQNPEIGPWSDFLATLTRSMYSL